MPREQTSSGHSSDVAGSEFFDMLREMSRNWMERASAEAERGSKLSKDLGNAHSVPDAVTAYQGWFSERPHRRCAPSHFGWTKAYGNQRSTSDE